MRSATSDQHQTRESDLCFWESVPSHPERGALREPRPRPPGTPLTTPVVHEDHPKDVLGGLGDGDRLSKFVPRTYKESLGPGRADENLGLTCRHPRSLAWRAKLRQFQTTWPGTRTAMKKITDSCLQNAAESLTGYTPYPQSITHGLGRKTSSRR